MWKSKKETVQTVQETSNISVLNEGGLEHLDIHSDTLSCGFGIAVSCLLCSITHYCLPLFPSPDDHKISDNQRRQFPNFPEI